MRLSKLTRRIAGASVIASAVLMVGCQSSSEVSSSQNDQTPINTTAANTSNRLYYPTGERSSSVILLERIGPANPRRPDVRLQNPRDQPD